MSWLRSLLTLLLGFLPGDRPAKVMFCPAQHKSFLDPYDVWWPGTHTHQCRFQDGHRNARHRCLHCAIGWE